MSLEWTIIQRLSQEKEKLKKAVDENLKIIVAGEGENGGEVEMETILGLEQNRLVDFYTRVIMQYHLYTSFIFNPTPFPSVGYINAVF